MAWLISRTAGQRQSGEQVWFYDESEKRLYPGNPETAPPDKGIGGKKNDGVRAIVVAFRISRVDSGNRRIAYLQTCTPELKTALEQARAARATGKPFDSRMLSRDSDFFQTNTLVKRPGESEWQPSNSPEAQRVMSEWHAWRGQDGQSPVLSVPE